MNGKDISNLSKVVRIMLEYVKTVLLKVSFDKMLFEKELRKGLRMLEREELSQFRQWCYEMFSDTYLITLSRVFHKSPETVFAG